MVLRMSRELKERGSSHKDTSLVPPCSFRRHQNCRKLISLPCRALINHFITFSTSIPTKDFHVCLHPNNFYVSITMSVEIMSIISILQCIINGHYSTSYACRHAYSLLLIMHPSINRLINNVSIGNHLISAFSFSTTLLFTISAFFSFPFPYFPLVSMFGRVKHIYGEL